MSLRLRFTLALFCLVALLLTPAASAIAADTPANSAGPLSLYEEPHGYFSLPVPQGWHSFVLEHPGERLYVFTPEDISPDQLRLGVDVVAIFTLRVSAMSREAAALPASELLRFDLDSRLKAYKEHGLATSSQLGPVTHLGGLDFASATVGQPGYDEFVAAGSRGRRYYVVEYQWETRRKDAYLPLLEQMAAGLRLPEPSIAGETTRYESGDRIFGVTLPAGWSAQEEHNGANARYRLETPSQSGTVRFPAKATLTRITRFSESLPGHHPTAPRDQAAVWGTRIIDAAATPEQKLFALDEVNLGGRVGFRWERSYRAPSSETYLQELRLVVIKDDTLYEVVLEAPLAEFELYRKTFEDALDGVSLN